MALGTPLGSKETRCLSTHRTKPHLLYRQALENTDAMVKDAETDARLQILSAFKRSAENPKTPAIEKTPP